jgi:hypothetical protein
MVWEGLARQQSIEHLVRLRPYHRPIIADVHGSLAPEPEGPLYLLIHQGPGMRLDEQRRR